MTDFRIWPATNGPNADAGDPAAPVSLGLIVQVSSTCWAKAIYFYRGATSITGPVKGRIFEVAGQTVVSGTAVDFTLSGTGWQTATLPTAIQLTANTSYKVTIHSDDNYTATGGYWATGAGVGGITNGPLTAPDAGGTPLGLGGIKQGSFGYNSNPDVYPDSYFGGGNYWVDLLVTDTDPAHTGTGTAALTLAASGTGAKRATSTGTAALTLSATRVGAKAGTGAASAGLGLAASSTGQHRGVGAVSAPLTLSTTQTGTHRGVNTGTAPITVAAAGVGGKQATAAGSAPVVLATGQAGAKRSTSTSSAPIALAAGGVGQHRGTSVGTAPLILAVARAGQHRGVGAGTAPLALAASGAVPGRDITLTIGTLTTGWTTGALGV